MTRRDEILEATRRLTLRQGVVPSLNAVAADAGVSKGGLIHHFPSRAALVAGLAQSAMERVDAAMRDAASRGAAAVTWLRLSVPDDEELMLFRSLAAAYRVAGEADAELARSALEAVQRWERMIADEVGDAARAQVIRLVGDGLAANVIAGLEPTPSASQMDALAASLGIRPGGAG